MKAIRDEFYYNVPFLATSTCIQRNSRASSCNYAALDLHVHDEV